jgi:biopolymer transport protein TolR
MGFSLKSSSSSRKRNQVMSEINVTPFVDVMLVLLIVFMVSAPLLTVGVPVNLPETNADSLPDDNEPLTVTINSKGEIFVQNTAVTYDGLSSKVTSHF